MYMSPKIVIPPSSSVVHPVDVKLESPYGKLDTVSVFIGDGFGDEKEFTTYILDWDMIKRLNEIPTLEMRLLGVEDTDLTSYIRKDKRVKFFAENKLVFCGNIKEVNTDDEFMTRINCDGWGIKLEKSITDQSTYNYWSEVSSDSIISSLVTEMEIGENENLGNISGSWSWENKLSMVRSIVDYFRADWWVSQEHPYDTDKLNVKQRRGRIPVVKNFLDDGSGNDNVLNIKKVVDTDNYLNDIILLGMRDYSFRLMEQYENTSLEDNTKVAIGEELKESTKLVVYINCDWTPQECYLEVVDSDNNTYVVESLNIVGGREFYKIFDLSTIQMGDVYKRPYGAQVNFLSHGSQTTSLVMKLGRLIQLHTQFSAVNNYYTRLDADIEELSTGIPFDISCEDSVWFPQKGIVRVGSDAIGYLNNEGNVLWNCISDTVTGYSNKHRSGLIVFPTYDAEGKKDTFLSKQVDTDTATTIYVHDTTGFPSSGSIIISDEVISYTGKTATSFTGCSRGQTGTHGLALPHSKYTRVFEYDSSKRYYPESPKSGSVMDNQGKKTKKYFNNNLNDIVSAEVQASSIMEYNLDDNVLSEGGYVSIQVNSIDVLGDLQEVELGDSVYIKSNSADVDGIFEVVSIRWFFDETYGMQCVFTCGSRLYGFIQSLESRWRVVYG